MQIADFSSHRIEGFARMGGKPFNVPLFSHIEGNLWTGGCPVNKAPQEFQFIVCLYPWWQYSIGEGQIFTSAKLFDSEDVPDPAVLHALAGYVDAAIKAGPTLVHCQAGLNRSGLIAALALMKSGKSAKDAIALLRDKRCDAVLCNKAFEKWLLNQ